MNVFIDTNVLVRFYAYSDDSLDEVEKIVALHKSNDVNLLITEQVVEELYRNRDRELAESFKRLESITTSAQIPRFAEHYAQASTLRDALKKAKEAKVALVAEVTTALGDGTLRADKVINDLFESVSILPRSAKDLEAARLRRELANPPGKNSSLGDQLNWEILLRACDEGDLHLVSRDGDFKASVLEGVPSQFLAKEWRQKKNGELHIYRGLAEFAKKHFSTIKLPSDATKSSWIKKLVNSDSFSETHDAISNLRPLFQDIKWIDAHLLLISALENNQIGWIISDDDVKSFYREIYLKYYAQVPSDLDEKLVELNSEVFDVPF